MNRKSVTHGTPAQLEAALENKISELTNADSSTKSVDDLENVTASVDWDHYDQYEPFMDQYLPAQGQGDTRATQLVTAITKLIYKWYNDGDVYDNNYGMDGWCNDLSSYANWIYNTYPMTQRILNKIKDTFTDSDYENILMELAAVCFDNDLLAKENEKPADGSIYTESGPFSFNDAIEEDEEDDYWDDDDEYDDIYNSTNVASDEYETNSRFYVYDAQDNVQSDGFVSLEDAIDFAAENSFPVVKEHKYYIDADRGGKLYPDGDPVVVWENGKAITASTDTSEWEMLQTKSVEDADGFMTDYTLYKHSTEDKYICMFGDSELYEPDEAYADWEGETEAEALEWFNSYSGLGNDTDTDIDTLLDNAGGVDYIREVVSEVVEAYPGIDEDVDELAQILSDRYDELTDYEWISVLQYLADDLGIYCATAVTAANNGLPYLDIDEDKLGEARQDLYNKLDELEESFPEIEWDNVESPEDIDIAMILYVNYGLQDGEDYQIGNGETDIIIDNKNDDRWHQVATDLNYSESDYLDSLGLEVVGLLEAQGYEAYSSVEDDNLEIEIVDEDGVQHWYLQPLDEIEPNWDDLNTDASTIADAAIEQIFG